MARSIPTWRNISSNTQGNNLIVGGADRIADSFSQLGGLAKREGARQQKDLDDLILANTQDAVQKLKGIKTTSELQGLQESGEFDPERISASYQGNIDMQKFQAATDNLHNEVRGREDAEIAYQDRQGNQNFQEQLLSAGTDKAKIAELGTGLENNQFGISNQVGALKSIQAANEAADTKNESDTYKATSEGLKALSNATSTGSEEGVRAAYTGYMSNNPDADPALVAKSLQSTMAINSIMNGLTTDERQAVAIETAQRGTKLDARDAKALKNKQEVYANTKVAELPTPKEAELGMNELMDATSKLFAGGDSVPFLPTNAQGEEVTEFILDNQSVDVDGTQVNIPPHLWMRGINAMIQRDSTTAGNEIDKEDLLEYVTKAVKVYSSPAVQAKLKARKEADTAYDSSVLKSQLQRDEISAGFLRKLDDTRNQSVASAPATPDPVDALLKTLDKVADDKNRPPNADPKKFRTFTIQ